MRVRTKPLPNGSGNGMPPLRRVMPRQWTVFWLSCLLVVLPGCQMLDAIKGTILPKPEPETVYIPGTRRLVPLKEGQSAPEDGYFVPPALMAEIGPCLANALREPDPVPTWKPTE